MSTVTYCERHGTPVGILKCTNPRCGRVKQVCERCDKEKVMSIAVGRGMDKAVSMAANADPFSCPACWGRMEEVK